MHIQELQKRAQEIRSLYEKFEQKQYGRSWTDEEIALGLVGDVGDLMKLVQGKNKIRNISDLDEKMAHELSDCLWVLFVLANTYNIDLETAFLKTMTELQDKLKKDDVL